MKYIQLQKLIISLLAMFIVYASNAYAASYFLLPAKAFYRESGQPVTQVLTFSALDTSSDYTMNLYNGGLEDYEITGELVSSSVIVLNGSTIFSPNEFNHNTTSLTKTINVNASNKLEITLRGRSGGVIVIEIIGTDNIPPELSSNFLPLANTSGWHNSQATIDYTCADYQSGIDVCPSTKVVNTEAKLQIISATATDIAGNKTTDQVTLNIDKTSPVITSVSTPTANVNGWNNTDVTTSFICTDVLSGVESCTAPIISSLEAINQAITGKVLDLAGNANTSTVTLNIDKTIPNIEAQYSKAANSAGWFNSVVSLNFICSDNLSGIQSCPMPESFSQDVMGHVLTASAIDMAGNVKTSQHIINVDLTAPVIHFDEHIAGTENNSTLKPLIKLSVADNLAIDNSSFILLVNNVAFSGACNNTAGAITCTPAADLPLGNIELKASISDMAGNLTEKLYHFVLQPDRDGDGVIDTNDQFPDDPTEWADLDKDGIGDNADLDRDGDGINNDYETQLGFNANDPLNTPADLDKDGIPDALDDDRDGDGVLNVSDVFPDDQNESSDIDGDGIGDNADTDRDGDGISNDYETQLGTNPNDPLSVPTDLDKDGIPDALDTDRDGDSVLNVNDAFPDDSTESSDLDGDGIGDNSDPDRDGDGINNDYETQIGFDPNSNTSTPADLDTDGIPDVVDTDRDGDGVLNADDVFPDNAAESSDIDGDGIGDNADPDRDGDGINNDYETQLGFDPNNNSSTPNDLDKDAIPDALDDDIDGDGVLNVDDLYPNDANRSRLAAINAITAILNQTTVDLSWQPATDIGNLNGYRIYRRGYGTTSWQTLADVSANDTQYNDAAVTNATAYEYLVRGLEPDNKAGESATAVSVFVAYNVTTVDQLSASRNHFFVDLNWTTAAAITTRIYQFVSANYVVIGETTANSIQDTNSHWSVNQQYKMNTVLRFTNPINQTSYEIEGPVSNVSVTALPGITLQINNANFDGSSWKLNSLSNDVVSIAGIITGYQTDVTITAATSASNSSVTSVNGKFELGIPISSNENIQLSISEINPPADRVLTTQVIPLVDYVAPQVLISTADNLTTPNAEIKLQGSVTEVGSGLQQLSATNQRFGDASFGLIIESTNNGVTTYNGEIPLQVGPNTITVTSTDRAGLTGQASINVRREAGPLPVIVFTSHDNGQRVNTSNVSIQGELYSSLLASQIQLHLAGRQLQPTVTATPQVFQFGFTNLSLQPGYNRLTITAVTTAGQSEAVITLFYNETATATDIPLAIDLTKPRLNSVVNAAQLIVSGQLLGVSDTSPKMTLQGQPVTVYGSATSGYSFSHALDVSTALEGEITLNITAHDGARNTVLNRVVSIDRTAPQLTIANNWQAQPVVNSLIEAPYPLTGVVVDSNISSLEINGRTIELIPVANNTYQFETNLVLAEAIEQDITITAIDKAGNIQTQTYTVSSNPQAQLDVIVPRNGQEIQFVSSQYTLDVTTKISSTQSATNVSVTTGTDNVLLPVTGSSANGLFSFTPVTGQQEFVFEVLDANNTVLARKRIELTMLDASAIPLEVVRTEPSNNSTGNEPNKPVRLYFNRPIDPALLQVRLKQTVHGFSYSSETTPGAELAQKNQGDIIEVHKDREPVIGNISLLPGNTVVEFYPEQDLFYNAALFAEVVYNSTELSRFQFKVRANPTFVLGRVMDAIGNGLAGINVTIENTSWSTYTDTYGNFGLGFGKSEEEDLKSGRFRLVLNAGMKKSRFGTQIKYIDVKQNQVNQAGPVKLFMFDEKIPSRHITSGNAQQILAESNLILNTTNATLNFPGTGYQQGNVRVQLADISDGIYYTHLQSAYPQWLYSVQPQGIKVSGDMQFTITPPKLNGDYNYLPANNTLVLLIGRDAHSLEVLPVGVGRLNNSGGMPSVESITTTQYQLLDYIGYSFVDTAYQSALIEYMAGRINLDGLIQRLSEDLN